ncbi:hypothetical protein CDD80_354 [Ophiocordyceps camponoti-rufipedis]|uniref:AAA+ ATPase domain-containing protein n=1 Tax=Ophiocordyceps camponoti-rufipedis TaxID=2004952 RepID=A0A2C5ZMQ4_9HYPO|nr:hypothetical protein CDD80_354 [Ophiocordyceps camponoti-rufipedis]
MSDAEQAHKSDDGSNSAVVVTPVAEDKEKPMVGLVAESKELYAKLDEHRNISWTDKKPDDFEEVSENEETAKYAVIVRKQKSQDADVRSLVIDSLIIQSPYLKRILADVLEGYPGILTDVARLKLRAPFECLVHRWDRLETAAHDPELEGAAKEHLELLMSIMRQELGPVIQLREDYFKNKAVAFEHAWTLFPPGCTVLGHKNGKPVAAKFRRGYYVETPCGKIYTLKCRIIEWDGCTMGWTDLDQHIPAFLGTMPFTSLPCHPLEYDDQAAGVKAMLTERGRRFEALAGYCYRSYRGVAIWHQAEPRKTVRENVQSRIVVDGANWEKENYDHQIVITALHREDDGRNTMCRRRDSFASVASSCSSTSPPGDSNGAEDGSGAARPSLTEEQLLVTSPMVRGYALRNKRWMEFFVDDVGDVEFDEQAFSSLVLPGDKKELILAFAQSQARYKDAFDDVISGKGKGIIVLLSGGPGIGKTLTAESVAEEMRVPLYAMSAGDLGSDAYDVENNLTRTLAMVADWNAVLLLDECDVFLEARGPHDLERNRIVAIFLRTLEYYQGILFLTTNRVRDMDPAFASRVHVSLEYPDLDAGARAAVWRSFLSRCVVDGADTSVKGDAAHDVSAADVDVLSELHLNGRVIKNVLKAANLLACHRGERLAMGHLRTVLQVEGHQL